MSPISKCIAQRMSLLGKRKKQLGARQHDFLASDWLPREGGPDWLTGFPWGLGPGGSGHQISERNSKLFLPPLPPTHRLGTAPPPAPTLPPKGFGPVRACCPFAHSLLPVPFSLQPTPQRRKRFVRGTCVSITWAMFSTAHHLPTQHPSRSDGDSPL